MTLNGHYAPCFKTCAPWCCNLFFSFTFSLLLVYKWLPVPALTFRMLQQVTIKESLGVGKTCCIARFPCDSAAFLFSLQVMQLGRILSNWNCIGSTSFMSVLCLNICRLCTGMPNIMHNIWYMILKNSTSSKNLARLLDTISKFMLFSVSG